MINLSAVVSNFAGTYSRDVLNVSPTESKTIFGSGGREVGRVGNFLHRTLF